MLDSVFNKVAGLQKTDLCINRHIPEVYPETCQTSKMGLFSKEVNILKATKYFREWVHLIRLTGFWICLCILAIDGHVLET